MGRVELDEGGLVELMTAADGPIARDLRKRAHRVRRAALRYAPVDTGRLRSSIEVREGRAFGGELEMIVGTDVEYALYQELGTRDMPAHPYLRPALSAAADVARRPSTARTRRSPTVDEGGIG
jgi:HK97 gp10 family phage protein